MKPQVLFQALPGADSSFRLRAYFLSEKKYPRYLFWRSHTVRGFEKKRESGDFVALPNDTALVWESPFLLEKDDPRSVNFYVIDNDLIVASAELKFRELNLEFTQPEPETVETAPESVAQKPGADQPMVVFVETKKELPVERPAAAMDSLRSNPTAPPTVFFETKKENPLAPTDSLKSNPTGALPKKLNLARDDFEIDGIVSSDVRTNFGRQFLIFFQEKWQPPEKVGGYWVNIREVLTPGRYTLISVSLNNRELFQRYLNPNQDYLKDLAAQTADLLVQILKGGDPDGGFSEEDLNGVGIE